MEKKIDFKLREGSDYITLIQLLKIVNIADSGGEAQAMVLSEGVRLNGQTETRKRAKIRVGDVVSVGDYVVTVMSE